MFKVVSHNEFWNVIGSTSRMGEINLVYSDIVLAFGEPNESDGYKVSGQWAFYNPDSGEAFTLYDWKSTELYDSDYPSVDDFRASPKPQTFNIGGNHKGDVEAFKRLLKAQIKWVKEGGRDAEKALLGSSKPLILVPARGDE